MKVIHLLRKYSALIVVISSALLVSATNLAAGHESSGFLFGYFGSSRDNYANPLEGAILIETGKKIDLALVRLAQASTSPEPGQKDPEEEDPFIEGQSLVAGMSPVKIEPEEEQGSIITYEVRQNDTLSSIAAKFRITTNTIMWANEIDDVDSIMPGDTLFILPVAGIAYTVKKSDTLDEISNKYKASKEKIIAFNDLPANGELSEGKEIIIPGGQKELIAPVTPAAPAPPAASTSRIAINTRPYEPFASVGRPLEGKAGTGHRFPYGYCTWYVAQKKYVPWGGNAGTWLYNAKAMGYATGKAPRPGSIMVSSESPWGHTALVESVNGNQFTVSEMNYRGFAKRSTRTINAGSRAIKGFIY